MSGLDGVRDLFPQVPGYLDVATMGLPTLATSTALHDAIDTWARGEASAVAYDEAVAQARRLYAGLVDVPVGQVAVGPQVSVFVGLVAAAMPDGAQVLTYGEEFSSVVFPFLAQADRGIRVRQVGLAELAAAVDDDTSCVAFSLAQSATGELADADEIVAAARRVGALTLCDTTQAVGWMQVAAARFDVTVCGTYKWLCSPRGTAFLTVNPDVMDRLRPLDAGWYAGESVWDSVYGPTMTLASSARRYDISPAWHPWVGTAEALSLFARLDPEQIRRHDIALANALRAALGLAPQERPVLSLEDDDGSGLRRLRAAGCRAAGRAGRLRVGFHLWNGPNDVDRAADALAGWRLPQP